MTGEYLSKSSLRSILFFVFLSFVHSSLSQAQVATSEDKLLSAFIFNIAKFIRPYEKPSQDASALTASAHANASRPTRAAGGSSGQVQKFTPFRIKIFEHQDLGQEMTKLVEGKKIDLRSIEVLPITSLSDLKDQDLLVIIPDGKRDIEDKLSQAMGCKCIVVTMQAGLIDKGSMVNFFYQEDHLRFDINLKNVHRENLDLDSQLLRLAKHVVGQ